MLVAVTTATNDRLQTPHAARQSHHRQAAERQSTTCPEGPEAVNIKLPHLLSERRQIEPFSLCCRSRPGRVQWVCRNRSSNEQGS